MSIRLCTHERTFLVTTLSAGGFYETDRISSALCWVRIPL